jgi:hypothetical protein
MKCSALIINCRKSGLGENFQWMIFLLKEKTINEWTEINGAPRPKQWSDLHWFGGGLRGQIY